MGRGEDERILSGNVDVGIAVIRRVVGTPTFLKGNIDQRSVVKNVMNGILEPLITPEA